MRDTNYNAVSEWPCVYLFQGIRMTYKGREMCFPKAYLGPSTMNDFDAARGSIDCKEAGEDKKELVVQRKVMTICSRVLLKDGYLAEDENITMQAEYAKRQRARLIIQKKIAEVENDDYLLGKLNDKLDEIPELPRPECVFPNEETVLSFGISNMSGEGTLPIDNVRLQSAYAELNYFEQEEVSDFLHFPGN